MIPSYNLPEFVRFVKPEAGKPNPNLNQLDVLSDAIGRHELLGGVSWGVKHEVNEATNTVKLQINMIGDVTDVSLPIQEHLTSEIEYALALDISVSEVLEKLRKDFMDLLDRR